MWIEPSFSKIRSYKQLHAHNEHVALTLYYANIQSQNFKFFNDEELASNNKHTTLINVQNIMYGMLYL